MPKEPRKKLQRFKQRNQIGLIKKYSEYRNKIIIEIILLNIKNFKDADIFTIQETVLHITKYVSIAINEIILLVCAEIDIKDRKFIQYKQNNKEMKLK